MVGIVGLDHLDDLIVVIVEEAPTVHHVRKPLLGQQGALFVDFPGDRQSWAGRQPLHGESGRSDAVTEGQQDGGTHLQS